MKVLGVGNALVDVLVRVKDDTIITNLGFARGSMNLIDINRFNLISLMIEELDKSIVSGGSASNTIDGLAAMDVETGFVGRIGKDVYGNLFKEDFKKQGITSHLIEVNEPSGVATTFISEDGERTFGTYLGAASMLHAKELRFSDFEDYSFCYVEGYLLQNHALIEHTFALAKRAKAKIVLDLASYNIVEANREFLDHMIRQYVDIVFANEEEAYALVQADPEEAVTKIAQMVNLAVVKTGATGSWIQRADEKIFVPAETVECIDTTGAGDQYAAGFLYGMIKQQPLDICAKIGTHLAGKVIETVGARIPASRWNSVRQQVEAFIV